MVFGLFNRKFLFIGLVISILGLLVFLHNPFEETTSGILQLKASPGSLTVLYDNYPFESGCHTEWGYSCLVETSEITVLFDTGGDPQILAHNIDTLGVNIQDIDCIIISHEHWDHVGGIQYILSNRTGIPVYLPGGVPYSLKSSIASIGGECIELGNATKISDSIAITDTINGPPMEQAMIIKTNEGVILITGCSHPGVENLARNAFELTEDRIRLVIGGYHLGRASKYMLDRTCDELDEICVEYIAASHCTGDESIQYFRERYGEHFIESGVGFNLEF
jgi:7,8-dihydropterin-6-yl-methyl-4-(beta-D-ribofuranosyl)aminobenzene 5'-phosphate synthase